MQIGLRPQTCSHDATAARESRRPRASHCDKDTHGFKWCFARWSLVCATVMLEQDGPEGDEQNLLGCENPSHDRRSIGESSAEEGRKSG